MADTPKPPDPMVDERVRARLSIAVMLESIAILGFVLYLSERSDWSLSPFTQVVVTLIVKHAIDNVGSMLQFYYGSSWGSAMKSVIMGRMGQPAVSIPADPQATVTTTTEVKPPDAKP